MTGGLWHTTAEKTKQRARHMDPALDQRFPSAKDIERAALRRMPKFIADYVNCGMGRRRRSWSIHAT